jgi:hypothetical protein
VLIVGIGMGALAPEVTDDALRFFLEVPRRVLLRHRLVPDECWPFGFSPLLPAGVNLPLLALCGGIPAKLLDWQAWVFTAILIFEWLEFRNAGRGWASLGAVAWLGLLNVPVLAQTAMPDCQLAAVCAVAAYAQFGRRGLRRLAGLLWGIALAYKYQAGFLLLGSVVAEIAARRPAAAARISAWALVPFAPHLIRNALAAGTPLAPFFMSWGPDGGTSFLPPFHTYSRWWSGSRTAGAMLAAPFAASTSVSIWDGLLSPLLVAGLPLAFPGAARGPLILIAVSVAAWTWQAGYAGRYLIPLAPMLLVETFAGISAVADLRQRLRLHQTARAVVFVAVAFEACLSINWAFYIFNPAGVALGKESPGAYLERMLSPRPATLRAGIRLRGVFEARTGYYAAGMSQAYYWPGLPVLDAEGIAPRMAAWASACPDAARLRVMLRARGVRYLVHQETPSGLPEAMRPDFSGWTPRSLKVYRDFFGRYPVLRFRCGDATGSFALYEFLDRPRHAGAAVRRLPLVAD